MENTLCATIQKQELSGAWRNEIVYWAKSIRYIPLRQIYGFLPRRENELAWTDTIM